MNTRPPPAGWRRETGTGKPRRAEAPRKPRARLGRDFAKKTLPSEKLACARARGQLISVSVIISDAIGVGYFFLIAGGAVAVAAAAVTSCNLSRVAAAAKLFAAEAAQSSAAAAVAAAT